MIDPFDHRTHMTDEECMEAEERVARLLELGLVEVVDDGDEAGLVDTDLGWDVLTDMASLAMGADDPEVSAASMLLVGAINRVRQLEALLDLDLEEAEAAGNVVRIELDDEPDDA